MPPSAFNALFMCLLTPVVVNANDGDLRNINTAVAYMKEQDFSHALETFDSMSKEEYSPKVYLYRALCASNLGDDDKAHVEIENARFLSLKSGASQSEPVLIEQVWGYIERPRAERPIVTAIFVGDSARAIKLATSALEVTSNDAELYSLRAIAYLCEEQYVSALADIDRAVEYDPLNSERYKLRAKILILKYPQAIEKGRGIETALVDVSKAISLQPTAGTYRLRAIINTFLGDYKAASYDFSKVLECTHVGSKGRAAILICRGTLRRYLGDDSGFRRDLSEAEKLQPTILEDYDPTAPTAPSAKRLVFIILRYENVGIDEFVVEELKEGRIARLK